MSERYPELKRRPGLTTWRPTTDRTCEVTYETVEDFQNAPMSATLKSKLSESHWVPENAQLLNLHHW